ncbi:hypothetical protein BGW80DRAFT_1563066 [Lactifluus volemus]|nr:hypothetical protein BGW80DRAFT_1563066 [Lactifluus volemus]
MVDGENFRAWNSKEESVLNDTPGQGNIRETMQPPIVTTVPPPLSTTGMIQALNPITGTIEGNTSTSTSVLNRDTQRNSGKHLDKEPTPYITADEAYTHALHMEAPLRATFASIGFSDEYILQAGFNEAALHESLLIEEIYLFLNGDLPALTDQAICEAFSSVFVPFPGVVCTRGHVYHLPVDPAAHGPFRHLSSLGDFNAGPSTSSGAGDEGTPGRDESGNGDHRGKGKSREDRPEGRRGKEDEEGGDDGGGNDPDPGVPSGGDNPRKSGIYITLKSTVSIKTGDTISHDVTTRADAVITVNRCVEDRGWPAPKIGVDMTTVAVSCKTLVGQPAYMLSQAEVQMTGCSTQGIVLALPEPRDVHLDGDTKKKTATTTSAGNIALGFVPPHGPNVTTGATMSKGQSMEQVAGRWEISFHELTSADHLAHLRDRTYSFVGGGYWQYIPNNEDFVPVKKAIFVDSLSPSGVFRMEERAPTKVEIKILSFWETQPRSGSRWNTLFKINWRRSAEQIPAFANVICGASTVVNLNLQVINSDRGPDRNIPLPFDDSNKFNKVKLSELVSEEPKHFDPVERVLDFNLEVRMRAAIVSNFKLPWALHVLTDSPPATGATFRVHPSLNIRSKFYPYTRYDTFSATTTLHLVYTPILCGLMLHQRRFL